MTVTSNTFQDEYVADGSTADFDFTWRITNREQLAVYKNEVLQVNETDYTFTDNIDTSGIGGTVSFLSDPAINSVVLLQREMDALQPDELRNNQALPPATIVKMIDRLTMLFQQAIRPFISDDTIIAASSTYTFDHALGKVPDRVQLSLVCQIADGGYAPDDVIDVNAESFFTIQRGFTDLTIRTGAGTTLGIISKVNTAANISPYANWKLRVYAS